MPRGRRPRPLVIQPADLAVLQQIVRSKVRPAFQVLRARALLGVAAGEPIAAVADQSRFDPASVWRLCRRYEKQGLAAVTVIATPSPKMAETSTMPLETEAVTAGMT